MQEKRRDRLQSVPQLHNIVNHCTSIFFKVLIDLMNVITWIFRNKQKRVTTAVLKIHLQASRVQQSKDQPWKESAADKTAPARVPSLLSIAGAAGGDGPKDAEAGGHRSHTPQGGLSPEARSELGTPIPDAEGVGEKRAFWEPLVHRWEKCGLGEFNPHGCIWGMQSSSWDLLVLQSSFLPMTPHFHATHSVQTPNQPPLSLSSCSSEKQHPLKCASVLCS